ncbi:hypothetical protein [Pseudomonas protegens]|uniref:hypothetical protein n=1 Tax=Pseudomonas protegens TaxID=380021 RepID=UPI00383A15B2
MSNEMITLPRELLELALEQLEDNWSWVDELRALLAKPAAQHQGEPVAWRGLNADGEVVTEWIDGIPPDRMVDLCGNADSFDIIERAYAEQPAPVAVVLPERKPEPSVLTELDDDRYAAIWNACLDKVASLNPAR